MVMSSIDFKSLGKPVQKALKKLVKIKRFGEIDKWGEYQSSLRDSVQTEEFSTLTKL